MSRAPIEGTSPAPLSASTVASLARQAGFAGDALVTAVAVAKAESGYRSDARGDTTIQTAKWGPSIGLWQIRSVNADKGTGRTRDEVANLDPSVNARHAYEISSGGTSFKPWTMYTNGEYKKHLAEARAAVSSSPAAAAAAPSAASSSTPVLANGAGTIGPLLKVRIGGVAVAGELGNALVGGKVDLTTSKVSEVTLEFEDRKLALARRHRINIGSPVDTLGLALQVVEISTKEGPAATPHLVVQCHPRGAVRMREMTPPSLAKISPTEYMRRVATLAGLRFVGEPSGVRDTIGPTMVTDTKGRVSVQRPQNAEEVGDYWARQLGFLAYEAGGTYYFADPTFLASHGENAQLSYDGMLYNGFGPAYAVIGVPVCKASSRTYHREGEVIPGPNGTSTTYLGSVDYLNDLSVRARVERQAGEALRPGMAVALAGMGLFDSSGGLLMTRVGWSLNDLTSPVDVEAGIATSLPAEGRNEDDDAANRAATGIGVVTLGTKMAVDFVTFCLRQVGDKYVFGAETDPLDPDPTAFDCSELIQWALAQVGIAFVDGSVNQINACTPITLDAAAKTRGALLFRPGSPNHIAVSLGDGKTTVEARGRAYGVVTHTIAGRFTRAGKVPGLSYG